MFTSRRTQWASWFSRLLAGSLIGCAVWASLPSDAAVIYRWVDESGRTHVSDVVPERYRKTAVRSDSSGSEVPTAQRQQAEQAAARDRALAEGAATRAQAATGTPPSRTGSSPPAAKRPSQGVTEATDCDTWRRLYRESTECFAPYRTARGATKAEGFERCSPIPSPELKCGPLTD